MSHCKDRDHTEWILIISTDKLYPAARALNSLWTSHHMSMQSHRYFLSCAVISVCVLFVYAKRVGSDKHDEYFWRKQEGSEHPPLISGVFVLQHEVAACGKAKSQSKKTIKSVNRLWFVTSREHSKLHYTSYGFSVVLPCVHTFCVDSSSFCFLSLHLPSPAASWRHERYLFPVLLAQSCHSLLWFNAWRERQKDEKPCSLFCFLKASMVCSTDSTGGWGHREGRDDCHFCHLLHLLVSVWPHWGLKIERRAGNAFVPSPTLSAQKEKFLRCAKLLSGANEGRSLTSLHARCHGNPSLNTSSLSERWGGAFWVLCLTC